VDHHNCHREYRAVQTILETLSEHNHIHQYILQRINTNVFPDIEALMHNFKLTTSQLAANLQMPGQHTRGTVVVTEFAVSE